MRSNWWIVVVIVGILLLGGLRVSGTAGSRKTTTTKKSQPVAVEKAPENVVVIGYGATANAARARALEQAQEKIVELLALRYGETGWRPSGDLLDPETLVQFNAIEEEGKVVEVILDRDKYLEARYKVQLTPAYLNKVEQQAKQDRVVDRHLLLARVLGGVVAVLLVVVAYLRLEEATHGYYTKMLRLAAFIVLALAGAGLWLTWP
jgi:hypothetical protein